MQRRTIAKIVMLVAVSGFLISYIGFSNVPYALIPRDAALDVAFGHLARAQAAQTPEQVMRFLTLAKEALPERGSVFWWSPEKANYESIQADLDQIISRADNISSLDVGDELFNSEMYAIHAEIETVHESLIPF